MTERSWFQQWFGEDYLLLYSHRTDDEARRQVAAVVEAWGERPRRVLDVACGGGRHTRAFSSLGIAATGLDLSPILLRRARRQQPSPPVVRGNMLRLPFGNDVFSAVVSFFTSIGYFESDDDNLQVLREMVRVLAPGGRLVLDTFNPGPTVASLVPSEHRLVLDRDVEIRRRYDSRRRRVEKEIVFHQGGRETRYLESVRAWEPDELTDLLTGAGVRVEARREEFDDGTLAEFRPDESPRLLVFGRKE